MKLRLSAMAIALASSWVSPAGLAAAATSTEAITPSTTAEPFELLIKMQHALKQLSYQFSFINISYQGVDSLRYRYALIDGNPFAQLLQIDGPRREEFQRGNTISYFDQSASIKPFSLPNATIIDGLPPIFYTDFTHLKANYHFITLGSGRVTDRTCDIIRIAAVDGTRYGYVVWLDRETALPLQAELLGQSGDTIEQFRVTDMQLGEAVTAMFQPLRKRPMPPVFSALPQVHRVPLNWQPKWLPAGMQLTSQTRRQILGRDHEAESQFYSDGLYEFTVNVTPVDSGSSQKSFSNGGRTLVMEIKNKKEITVVGMIPMATAQRILHSIKLVPAS